MIKIKTFLLATLLLTGLVFPATAQIGEPRSNFSVGVNGGVNLNSASFTPTIKQNSLMGITGGLTARYISEKYFAMICGAQVELNISQRGWDELFEMEDENGQTIKVPGKTYTRKMTYVDIPFLAHLAFGRERGLQFFVHAGPQIGFLIGESETIEGIDMNTLSNTQKAIYGVKNEKSRQFFGRRSLLFCLIRLLQYNKKRLFRPRSAWHNHCKTHLSF